MARYGQAHRCYSSTPSSDDYWSKKSYAPEHITVSHKLGTISQHVDEFFTEAQAGASRSKVAPKSTGYEGYDYGDYFRIQGGDKEPAMITGGGRARPSHSTWAAPGDATTEVAKPSATTSSRYRKPAYTARLYGTRPSGREDGYTSTIDGREAARKYDGSGVNPIPE
ncbi:hypothetical protein OIU74_021013 [Salix koriyanagi]|uniref:Uncharacterized protein n=1 Tax=Salix koriyanagi TaxID=2511006 RepID=A0A9Q0SMV8_9ROSI|nr:hypothetical protein OIU74_021013 [Salix koriyanagi]